ncbi:hypothetical protein IKQ26_08040 [bacterium]|nr:hypothetical protein [bacterium]
MKKLAILLTFVILSSGFAFAGKYPKYDAEVSKIRSVKNARTSVINQEMKDISVKMEELQLNNSISPSEKSKQMREYNRRLNNLALEKTEISNKYNADKARLKELYKH